MICSNCGKENFEGASFCEECGHKLEQGNVSSNVCENCGAPLTAGDRFCQMCGVPISVKKEEAVFTKKEEPKCVVPNREEPKEKGSFIDRLDTRKVIIATAAILVVIAGAVTIPTLLKDESDSTSIYDTTGCDYNAKVDVEENNIPTKNGDAILMRSLTEKYNITGNKKLSTAVDEWSKEMAKWQNVSEYATGDYSDVETEVRAAVDEDLYGTDDPVYFFSKLNTMSDEMFEEHNLYKPRRDARVLDLIYWLYEELDTGTYNTYLAGVFDAKDGRELYLEDVSTDSEKLYNTIMREAYSEIVEYGEVYPKTYEIFKGNCWDETVWYFTDNGIALVFPEGLVAVDRIDVEVPYDQIAKYIKEEYLPEGYTIPEDSEEEIYLTTDEEAMDYVLDYLNANDELKNEDMDIPVDGVLVDSEDEDGYWIRGYSDMGTHITKVFLWYVSRDGYIYDEDMSPIN